MNASRRTLSLFPLPVTSNQRDNGDRQSADEAQRPLAQGAPQPSAVNAVGYSERGDREQWGSKLT